MMELFPNYNAGRTETPGDWARAREAEGWHGVASMQIVRELFHTGRCRFAGKHYQIEIDEPDFADLSPIPPQLIGSASGPRTLREIPRHVDRIEIQPNASATRGGAVDLAKSAEIEESHVRDAVARVRRVREDLPLGIFVLVGAVPPDQVEALRAPFGRGFLSRFFGEPAAVAQAIADLEGLGFDRAQLTEMAPGTHERLRPWLAQRRARRRRAQSSRSTPRSNE